MSTRTRALLVLLWSGLLMACGGTETPSEPKPEPKPAVVEPEVPLPDTGADLPARQRRLACLELGKLGGPRARDRLLELLTERTGDPVADGATHLYAAAGLTLLADPGTAIDLVLNLSAVNPDDNIAALASEERSEEYFTVDAQLSDALLGMGMWTVEEDLARQLRRRHRIRVLIDAHAVLKRHTGIDLPFRYNGSYQDRIDDAQAWLDALRASRPERLKNRPFALNDSRFVERCTEVVSWLGKQSMNNRLMAHRVLAVVGPPAVPVLIDALRSDNPVAQRQAALMLGRIGDAAAAPALRDALANKDDDARAEAVDALRRVGDPVPRKQVAAMLQDSDAEVRAAAASYLGKLGDETDVPLLEKALESERGPGTRTALLCALYRRGSAKVKAELVEVFVSGEQIDRDAALQALLEREPLEPSPTALDPIEERRLAAQRFKQ